MLMLVLASAIGCGGGGGVVLDAEPPDVAEDLDASEADADADANCACPEEEPCCDDACGFRDATRICGWPSDPMTWRTHCVVEDCGGHHQVETLVQLCSGSSAACDGEIVWRDPCVFSPCEHYFCAPERRCQPLDETTDPESFTEDDLCPLDASCS